MDRVSLLLEAAGCLFRLGCGAVVTFNRGVMESWAAADVIDLECGPLIPLEWRKSCMSDLKTCGDFLPWRML